MLKIASPRQMQDIDRETVAGFGISSLGLMENAAGRIAEQVYKITGALRDKKVLVAAGKGNNGGDAFAAARILSNEGYGVCVYMAAPEAELSGDALVNFERLSSCGNVSIFLVKPGCGMATGGMAVPVSGGDVKHSTYSGISIKAADDSSSGDIRHDLQQCDVVVDGLFGTGFKGKAEGVFQYIIDEINDSCKTVISIDIPSGVDGATGKVSGSHIKASSTVTFALLKAGLVLSPGCLNAGEVVIADIGIPPEATGIAGIRLFAADAASIGRILPGRPEDSNKGDYGQVLIITGSTGMTGAGILAGKAALRSGAGLVYLGVPASLSHIYECASAETITIPVYDGGSGYFCPGESLFSQIRDLVSGTDVVAAGPGMSQNEGIADIAGYVAAGAGTGSGTGMGIPVILDADALNSLSVDVRKNGWPAGTGNAGPILITPHPGEMSRLTGLSIREIQEDRIGIALKYAAAWNVTILLKGYRTVIASPEGKAYINMTGNPGMATAGSGDVLTGIIAALAGQYIGEARRTDKSYAIDDTSLYASRNTRCDVGFDTFRNTSRNTCCNTRCNANNDDFGMSSPLLKAAVAGAYLHGLAGDMAAAKLGYHSLIAGDIIKELPGAFIKTTAAAAAN